MGLSLLIFIFGITVKMRKKIRKCKPGISERYRKMSKKCLCNSQYCSPQHTGRNRLVHKSSSYFNSIHKNKRDWRNLNKIIDIKIIILWINANDYLMIRMRFIPIPRLKQNLPINKHEWWILFALNTKSQNYSSVLTQISRTAFITKLLILVLEAYLIVWSAMQTWLELWIR